MYGGPAVGESGVAVAGRVVSVGVASDVGDAGAGEVGVVEKGGIVGLTVLVLGLFSAIGFGLEGSGELVAVIPGSIRFGAANILVGSKIWMTGENHTLGGGRVDTEVADPVRGAIDVFPDEGEPVVAAAPAEEEVGTGTYKVGIELMLITNIAATAMFAIAATKAFP